MIAGIEHRGFLIQECSLPGETRADNVFPALADGIQVSNRRFLLVYSTRGWRGVDDNLSIVYQLRDGAYDGRVVKEGLLTASIDDWNPLGNGTPVVKAHSNARAFGVPKGAVIQGRKPPNENVFAVKWLRVGRHVDPQTGFMLGVPETQAWLAAATTAAEWVQFRLNDDEDDIEILQPVEMLRQKGFETSQAFCEADVTFMSSAYGRPVPFDAAGAQWIEYAGFDGGRVAPLKYVFNADRGLYEWREMGPLTGGDLMEPSVTRHRDRWVVAARISVPGEKKVKWPPAWAATDDPFGEPLHLFKPSGPKSRAPICMFTCPDGTIRLLGNAPDLSPYRHARNPLYCWNIDPASDFAAAKARVIFDGKAAGVPIRDQSGVIVDNGRLLPHAGGDTQYLLHRVRPGATNNPERAGVPVNDRDKSGAGVYYATVRYSEAFPGEWAFNSPKGR